MTRRDQELLDKQLVRHNRRVDDHRGLFGWHSHRRYSVFGTKQADKNYVA